ncbi:hypothetical protein HMPREF9123_0196 [Neisseria bacilliformis ATCC BAA-1200]|uniref:Uncharacterized protein n=1 Tax=Neisseria bacilliformis ATCC BAA-1200 TaxID=888742 RepID=F2B8Z3_9NEIS|nr:hypothetical protein HMPREF9123_0196 [Neisseria bacilliformis ATCC BAA-1200]
MRGFFMVFRRPIAGKTVKHAAAGNRCCRTPFRFGCRPEKYENLCLYQGLLTFSLRDGFFE